MASESTAQPLLPANRKRVPLGRSRRRLSFERRLRIWMYALGVPTLALSIVLLREEIGLTLMAWLTVAAIVATWLVICSFFMEQIVKPLQTLSNVVASLREDDYSFRARGARRNDAVGDLALEVNALAGMLQAQRSGALEAMALVERVMAAIESPVLAFDPGNKLQMMNAAGEKAFGASAAMALGATAEKLGMEHLLTGGDGAVVSLHRQGSSASDRWVVKLTYFRLRGVRHTLLMLSNVSKVLREEERQAWTRLIRVLGHEINNSLAPIKSIAGSLRGRLSSAKKDEDFERGLAVIENRAESLNRFLQAYRELMGLPEPRLAEVSLSTLLQRVAHVEARLRVAIVTTGDVLVHVDADQIEQALINLVRNATEAALGPDAVQAEPTVEMAWRIEPEYVVVSIFDNGPGLTNEGNLFVPFYTTKAAGTGIGLVLAQQIAEAHHGSLRLMNRVDTAGCVVELRLPRSSAGA